jgi:hypothetical protein
MRSSSIWSLKKCCLLAALAIWPALAAAGPLKVEAEDAADHHVSAQGSYKGGLSHSWEYKLGSKRSAPNITGISAHGLLAIHRLTGLEEHEQSAVKAAKSLIWAYDQGWSKFRPFSQDIEFLAAAGFGIDAARWFQVTTGHYPAHAYVDLVVDGRKRAGIPTVAGWDVASAIRAALAVGQVDYARGLLAELIRRQGEWDQPKRGRDLARGSVLWAMAELRDRAGLNPDEQRVATGLLLGLIGKQQPSGAWLEADGAKVICTQTTAYATLGLSRWTTGKSAASTGRRWLARAALTDKRFFQGGRIWATTYTLDGQPENDFNAEIQSEAMMALATARR